MVHLSYVNTKFLTCTQQLSLSVYSFPQIQRLEKAEIIRWTLQTRPRDRLTDFDQGRVWAVVGGCIYSSVSRQNVFIPE